MMKQNNKSKVSTWIIVVCHIVLFLGVFALFAAIWYVKTYGYVGFDAILYTLFDSGNGGESGIISNFLFKAVFPAVLITALLGFIVFFRFKQNIVLRINEKLKLHIYPFTKLGSVIVSIVLSLALIGMAAVESDLIGFINNSVTAQTTFIEENYKDPENTNIVFPNKKQNVIIIYLESMETSFLSYDLGGGNDVNPIPELFDLAQQNINFSHNETVGGFNSLTGSTWTIGALVSMNTGVPFKTPINIDVNNYGKDGFLPGITTMTDILHNNGYYQTLMVGSDAYFGGRKQFYENHGVDKVYDLFTAQEDGIVPEDYFVWWGMEDKYLFEYAKQELLEISKKDQPFAFSMLTVDTHHIDGYFCTKCRQRFTEQYENVLSCSSRQVVKFVDWLKEQDFYEDTTIILTGDHPSMDGAYVDRNLPKDYKRKVYNCFINSKAQATNIKNRQFSTFDMFPTMLASIGCTIEGDRLGLGTNLFSTTPTFCEQLGVDEFNQMVASGSSFYNKKFLMLEE